MNPQRHAAGLMARRHPDSKAADWLDFVSVSQSFDLDGDGTDDLLLDGGASATTHTYFLYIVRGACGHYFGRYELDFRPSPLGSSHNGLFDLSGRVSCVTSCCPVLIMREMEFDGTAYRVVRSRESKIDCGPMGF